MLKLLLLVGVIAVLAWMLGARRRGGGSGPDPGPAAKPPPAGATPMLACAHCGVHLPQAEALTDGAGLPYCSQAHRAAGPK
jgi:uncharacterized protein